MQHQLYVGGGGAQIVGDVKIEYVDITPEEFKAKMKGFTENLDSLFNQSHELEAEIKKQLAGLKYE